MGNVLKCVSKKPNRPIGISISEETEAGQKEKKFLERKKQWAECDSFTELPPDGREAFQIFAKEEESDEANVREANVRRIDFWFLSCEEKTLKATYREFFKDGSRQLPDLHETDDITKIMICASEIDKYVAELKDRMIEALNRVYKKFKSALKELIQKESGAVEEKSLLEKKKSWAKSNTFTELAPDGLQALLDFARNKGYTDHARRLEFWLLPPEDVSLVATYKDYFESGSGQLPEIREKDDDVTKIMDSAFEIDNYVAELKSRMKSPLDEIFLEFQSALKLGIRKES